MTSKTIALAITALIGSASFAAADYSYFSVQDTARPSTSVFNFDLIRSAGNGTVEIYDLSAGEIGALIGTSSVRDGANSNVKVRLDMRPVGDVIAVLKVDGQTVASQKIDVTN